MTEIGWNWESYLNLPKIVCIDSDKFRPHTLVHLRTGVFDPETWGLMEAEYQPGKYLNANGEKYYDDTIYKEAPELILTFKHSPFGNTWGKNIGLGHLHVTHIVSTNSIKPMDVMERSENGDIYFFADIKSNPPQLWITQADGTEEMTLEITPFLPPHDLAQLVKNGKFVHTMKKQYMQMESKVFELESDIFVKTSEAASAQITCLSLQEQINSLYQFIRITMEKVNAVKLQSLTEIQNGIEMVEGKWNFGFPAGQYHFEQMDKTAALLQDNIRAVNSQIRANGSLTKDGRSEAQDFILFTQCLSVMGRERMVRFLGGVEQHSITTPNGIQRMTISNNPSPIEMLIQKAQLVENGIISSEDFKKNLTDYMESQRQTFKSSPSINGAVETLKADLIQGGNGNARI